MAFFLAVIHVLALPLGAMGILLRLKALSGVRSDQSLKDIIFGDNLWGIAAVIWISTGLLRVFGGFAKGSEYYLQSHYFYLKILFFLVIIGLEIFPMVTLVRWRIQKKKIITDEDLPILRRMQILSAVEIGLIFLVPIFAVAMARGGFR